MQKILVIGLGRVGKGITQELTNRGYHVENYSSKKLEINQALPFNLLVFDAVYWCARESGIPTDISNSGKLFSSMLFEIEKLKWKGVFVFLSSAGEVYGEGLGYPALETTPLRPISDYGKSKVRNEEILQKLAFRIGFELLIARISSIYENHEADPGIFGAILKSVFFNHELTIIGGNQSRDFIHLQDVNHCLIALIESANFSIFNVAAGNSITIFELVKIFEDKFGHINKIKIIKKYDGIKQSQLSIEKMKGVVTAVPQLVHHRVETMIFKA